MSEMLFDEVTDLLTVFHMETEQLQINWLTR